jgi:hypothetical protein
MPALPKRDRIWDRDSSRGEHVMEQEDAPAFGQHQRRNTMGRRGPIHVRRPIPRVDVPEHILEAASTKRGERVGRPLSEGRAEEESLRRVCALDPEAGQ